jgi:mannose-1-phosphate guanylyltransferase / mannose-6-phosphate isomerase
VTTVRITPVVLSGGAGTRLWPMSREQYPKQLQPLAGNASLLEEALRRFADANRFAPPLVVTNETLRFPVAEQLRLSGLKDGQVVLEPVARNTGAAVAAAALLAAEADPEAVLLVVPSDHIIGDVPTFQSLLDQALPAARDGWLVTFAVVPSRAETGYGYIRRGEALAQHPGVYQVGSFVEKPDAERAQRFLSDGDFFWNSGMFLFAAETILAELERHAPDLLAAVRPAVAGRRIDLDFVRLEADAFAKAPAVAIDYAVMERTDRAATIPCAIGWTDVGSWAELWNIGAKDTAGNVVVGDAVVEDSRNCYIRGERRLVAALGVDDLVLVATDDAVLVMPRGRAQDLRLVIERLRRAQRTELIDHRRVMRPWGSFLSIHSGERFQAKELTVKPGAKLSLQMHYHRAEHWVVVNGTALVTRGDQTQILRENESLYIPAGTLHRLENPGKVPLSLIEVQSGCYLGEDDIVRFEDSYGRVEKAEAGPSLKVPE